MGQAPVEQDLGEGERERVLAERARGEAVGLG